MTRVCNMLLPFSGVPPHMDCERALLRCREITLWAPEVAVAVDPRVYIERVTAGVRFAADIACIWAIGRVLASDVQQQLVLAREAFIARVALKGPVDVVIE